LIRFLLILAVILLSACAPVSTPEPSTVQLTEADDGSSIELHSGDRLEIALSGNPTTGFQWEVKSVDTDILQPVGEQKFEPSSNAVGSGGSVRLSLEAKAPGQTKLELIYHRSFEENVAPIQTFEVTVTVR
jgi:inhibitor of cysteine peptidase